MGQQIAFIIIIVLCGMILTQLFITKSELKRMCNIIEKKLSAIEDKLSKNNHQNL